jgi:tetratricopeptide (TPR) repeat protein
MMKIAANLLPTLLLAASWANAQNDQDSSQLVESERPEAEAAADPEEGWAELSELAASKRAAAISLNVELPTGQLMPFSGAFISEDGLALVDLGSIARSLTPEVHSADGTRLDFGTILRIFQSPNLALMRFEHRPKAWLRLGRQEPEVGDTVALVLLDGERLIDGKTPPVIGQIMAKRSGLTSNLLLTQFERQMSFGSGLSSDQSNRVAPGCFAIDRAGDVIGFYGGTRVDRSQTLRFLTPVVELAALIPSTVEAGKVIPFPLPAANNPIDPAFLASEFRRAGMAEQRGDLKTARLNLESLLERYPDSLRLKIHVSYGALQEAGEPLLQLADFTPDPKDPRGQQVACLKHRATMHLVAGDEERMMKDIEAAIALSPDDFEEPRWLLGTMYLNQRRPVDAERLFREAYAAAPESIEVIERLKDALLVNKKYDEIGELTKRVGELRKIYRRQWGVAP